MGYSTVSSKARNKLLRFFTEKEFSHHEVLKMVKSMEGMTEEQKEEHSTKIFDAIKNCKTEEEAIKALKERNYM